MRRGIEIMIRKDPEPPLFINKARICDNLREVSHKPMVSEDGLYVVEVGITEYLQVTPCNIHKNPTLCKGKC